ncbi:diguanylate cyclase [Plastorhodobacter daqingensis]|uniref:diguanylate cyclase n=1 Tax=Plastorhodobacter daqingensis TaxID=1387281 RepID=A0ABW2UEJ0_9RHOB
MAGRILIVDDGATGRIILKMKLVAAFYDILQADSGGEALQIARGSLPDLILVEDTLADMTATALCAALRADPLTARIPLILFAAASDAGLRIRALEAGVDEVIVKPYDDSALLAQIRSALRTRQSRDELRQRVVPCDAMGLAETGNDFAVRSRIALIAPHPQAALAWRRALAPYVDDDLLVIDRAHALSENEGAADLYLIAADLIRPGDGLQLISELRSRAASRHAAICIVLSARAHGLAAMALDLGADALVPERFHPQELALRVQAQLRRKHEADRLRASVRQGLRLAATDPLTGLYNRRFALPQLARIEARARDTGRAFAVMVIDLDHFKDVNDTWGHAAGDAVLVALARRMRQILRPGDLLARVGGEEFLMAMPDTDLSEARGAAEGLRRMAEAAPVPLPGGGSVRVTLSIGLAVGGGCNDPNDGEGLMLRADRALLAAKSNGRNRVTIGLHAA